jgi:hypothetical protein
VRIPRNKQNRIVNKEYSRLPYWTDDGYEDVQKSVSQKYVADNFGQFPESENQQPYRNDGDYQQTEYDYQAPSYNDWDLPNLPTIAANTGTRDCEGLWAQLFPDRLKGPFIPNQREIDTIRDIYAPVCDTVYIPHICCGTKLKISGPSEIASGGTGTFSVNAPNNGCHYEFYADDGTMWTNGSYTAPTISSSKYIYVGVRPYLGDDGGKDCADLKKVKITAGLCNVTITPTIQQMATSQKQTLSVSGGVLGETYAWAILSGGGSLSASSGSSVDYTAPSSNANCANNPTIQLSCNGNPMHSITIAVNDYGTNDAGRICTYIEGDCIIVIAPGGPNVYYQKGVTGYIKRINCDGTLTTIQTAARSDACWAPLVPGCGCDLMLSTSLAYLLTTGLSCDAGWNVAFDVRTAADKANGCCPSQLL